MRSLAFRPFASVSVQFGPDGSVSGLRPFAGRCTEMDGDALYRAFRHCTGTGIVACVENDDPFAQAPDGAMHRSGARASVLSTGVGCRPRPRRGGSLDGASGVRLGRARCP
jgi:hypothetical protein